MALFLSFSNSMASLAFPSSMSSLTDLSPKLNKNILALSLLGQTGCLLRHLGSQKTCLLGFNRHPHS